MFYRGDALSPLLLQTLLLPIWNVLPLSLQEALTQSLAQGKLPWLVRWAPTLTHLRIECLYRGAVSLLPAVTGCTWPALQKLHIGLSCQACEYPAEAARVALLLQCWRWPQSASLTFRLECFGRDCPSSELDPAPRNRRLHR